MKILAICSALDLRLPYSCTPAWWQLLQALTKIGVEVVATPYAGAAMDTPWWTVYPNPCKTEGDLLAQAKGTAGKIGLPRAASGGLSDESRVNALTRRAAHAWVRPRWERHLARILERERDVSAVLMLTVPPNHLVGLPAAIERSFGVPFYFYDGDVPASLPRFAGFQSGFRIYQGADLSEFTAFFSNSKGGGQDLEELGAKRVVTLYFGADPELFSRLPATEDIDVFFYGHGGEYRKKWIAAMLGQASHRLEGARFAVRGGRFGVDLGRTESLPYLSFAKLREYCCRSKINLLITRDTHALVHGSSTCRPFELAAMGCCMVSNPYHGIEEWFAPEKEVIDVHDEDEAVERYRWLLAHDAEHRRIGEAARNRLLREHTYEHRARQLVAALRG